MDDAPLSTTQPAARRKRRWYQFSLRTLLLVVLVAACPLGWLGVKVRQARRQKAAVRALRECGAIVIYDYWYDESGRLRNDSDIPVPVWLRWLLGDDFLSSVRNVSVGTELGRPNERFDDAAMADLAELHGVSQVSINAPRITDAGLAHLQALSELKELWINGEKVSNKGLQHLKNLTQLNTLCLDSTGISDAGLAHLTGLSHLKKLALDNTSVTDAGMVYLANLKDLDVLSLAHTRIGDSGVEHLSRLGRLKELDLHRTKISEAGIKRLQQALPHCKIISVRTFR